MISRHGIAALHRNDRRTRNRGPNHGAMPRKSGTAARRARMRPSGRSCPRSRAAKRSSPSPRPSKEPLALLPAMHMLRSVIMFCAGGPCPCPSWHQIPTFTQEVGKTTYPLVARNPEKPPPSCKSRSKCEVVGKKYDAPAPSPSKQLPKTHRAHRQHQTMCPQPQWGGGGGRRLEAGGRRAWAMSSGPAWRRT